MKLCPSCGVRAPLHLAGCDLPVGDFAWAKSVAPRPVEPGVCPHCGLSERCEVLGCEAHGLPGRDASDAYEVIEGSRFDKAGKS